MMRSAWLVLDLVGMVAARANGAEVADLVIHHAHVVTLDDRNTVATAVAVTGERILAVGPDADLLKLAGPKTRVIDANGHTVLPGLYDGHTHPVDAAASEADGAVPDGELGVAEEGGVGGGDEGAGGVGGPEVDTGGEVAGLLFPLGGERSRAGSGADFGATFEGGSD